MKPGPKPHGYVKTISFHITQDLLDKLDTYRREANKRHILPRGAAIRELLLGSLEKGEL